MREVLGVAFPTVVGGAANRRLGIPGAGGTAGISALFDCGLVLPLASVASIVPPPTAYTSPSRVACLAWGGRCGWCRGGVAGCFGRRVIICSRRSIEVSM